MEAPRTCGIQEAVDHVVDRLAGAGVPASGTARGIQIPGIWVHVTSYEPLTLGGAARINVAVDLIAEDQEERTAIVQLEDMLAAALPIVTPDEPIQTDNAIEIGQQSFPSFRITTTLEYTKE